MRSRALSCLVLTVALAACTSPDDVPPGPTSTAEPSPTAPVQDVAITQVCGSVDSAAAARLLARPELTENRTTGESYASVECSWTSAPSGEPAGTLVATAESSVVPEGTDPRDLLGDRCAEREVTDDGPGQLSCSSGPTTPATVSSVGLVAVEGEVLVELAYDRDGGTGLTDADRADLDQVVTTLLAAMPTP